MWFFGNLYEAIVIGPNMLIDSVHRLQAWQEFFVLTNPIFFYVPVTQLATIVLVVLFIKTPDGRAEIKRFLKWASILQVVSIILSIYIITQINLKLFFGDLSKISSEVFQMALMWNVLNIVRVFLVGVALCFIFKAYIRTQKELN